MVYIKNLFVILVIIGIFHKETQCRPQNDELPFYPEPSVQTNSEKAIGTGSAAESKTKEILEKIANVNKQHGFYSSKKRTQNTGLQVTTGYYTNENVNYLLGLRTQESTANQFYPQYYRTYEDDSQSRSVDSVRNIVFNYPYYQQQTLLPTYYQATRPYYPSIPNYYYDLHHNYYRENNEQHNINTQYIPLLITSPLEVIFNPEVNMLELAPQTRNCESQEERKPKAETAQNRTNTKEFIFDNINISVNDSDRSAIYRILSRLSQKTNHPQVGTTTTTETSRLKRPGPGLFKPALWFNNKLTNTNNHSEGFIDDDFGEDKGIFPDRKKVFNKQNTGSGIFIHKLKVRKGGVAIAGPGGIATAGSGGTAIVGPNGYAFTQPDSLAIAGSGSKVIAVDPQINLRDLVNNNNLTSLQSPRVGRIVATGPVVYYNKGDPKTPIKITLLPFYGGARGQTLQITETADGSVMTEIIPGKLPSIEPVSISNSYIVENPTTSAPHDEESNDYGQNIKNIHRMALNVMRLQETAKTKGLDEREEAAYKEYMESLNKSAHNLAKIYEGDDDDLMVNSRAGLSGWFARKKSNKKDKKKEEEDKKRKVVEEEEKKKEEDEERKKKEEEEKKRKEEEEKKKKQEEEDRKKKEEEKNKEQEMESEDDDDDDDSAANQEETSVAEAKPVGLAVAGIGGVAASKPIATAVVGPGGLAIARPVGTAIAGVSPDQALVPIYAEGFLVPSKPTNGKGDKRHMHSTEYLNKIINRYHQV